MNSILTAYSRKFLSAIAICLLAVCASAEQLRDWTDLPDFTALRMEVGSSPDFAANCGIGGSADNLRELDALFGAENWVEAEKLTAARLNKCPVDIAMHQIRAIVLVEMGRDEEAQPHIDWYDGLLDSIIASGDGKTPATAFVSISIAEEYALIRSFGMTATSQTLTDDAQDLFTVVDENGDEHSMYFFPELHWLRLQQLFPDGIESSE